MKLARNEGHCSRICLSLQVSSWQKVAVYHSLRAMLEHGLEVEPLQDFILVASKQLRASPEVREEQQGAFPACGCFIIF